MGRGPKPVKGKVEARPSATRKSRKDDEARVRDLEKRLAEVLKLQAEAQEQLQTRDRELAEALDQQTATGDVLRAISRSPATEQAVFDAIVRSAVRLCHAASAAVFRLDAGLVYEPANYGLAPERLAATRARYPRPLDMETPPGVAILTRSVFHVADTEDPATNEHVRQTGRLLQVRSIVGVPILRESEAVGALVITRCEPGGFSDAEIALLKTFADQAVIAIENVRLFNETKEALEQQTATSEILRVISRSPTDVQPTFDAIAESAVQLCGAEVGLVTRLEGDWVVVKAVYGTNAAGLDAIRRVYPMRPSAASAAARAIRDCAIAHIPDVLNDESYGTPETALAAGFRAALAVPMVREGSTVGSIAIGRGATGEFSERQIRLLGTFADQAVIAIENVRLFTELQANNQALKQAHAQVTNALEQQTATAELLRVISQAQTNVQPVFEAIAESAVRLLGAWGAVVFRYDGELIRLAAVCGGLPGTSEAVIELRPEPPTENSLVGRTILTRAVQHIIDIETDLSWRPALRENARRRGWRSNLQVPMLSGDEALGVIGVSRVEPGGFSPAEIALLQTFADQAVIAVKNARLLEQLQARTAQLTRSVGELTALGDVGRALNSTLDLETVLKTIVLRANELAGTAGCNIWEYDETREQFHLRVSHFADERDGALLRSAGRVTTISRGQGVTTRVMERQEPVQIDDITTARDYESPIRRPLIEAGHRALLGVPLMSEDEVIGVLTVTRKTPGAFEPDTVRLLSTFATQSALAIQNARLFREIEDKSRQLEVASQHKSEFLANMSHELRTPLNAIIGFSEVLTDRMFGDLNEKQEEYLKDIYASGTHLLSLINDILDLSKIEAGRMELELTEFHFPTAIENALMLVRERAGRRSLTLQTNIDDRLGHMQADERKIRQVVLNLLSNAIKFTPEGGRIEVSAAPKNGFVEVSVSDTGIGIASEDQEKVFEEFRQVGTAAKKVEGTGLGLTLCRKFVELHSGKIWVKSQLGAGATFTFTIPVTHLSPSQAPE